MISRHRLPFLSWPRLSGKLLHTELFAGLSVGLMVIPQGVAYAALAGMPLITGIYASLLPAFVAALFSASTRLSVGPTALTAMLVSASLAGMAAPGSAEWVNLAIWLSVLTGLLQIVLGFARFGWLLNLVSSPVLTAFTQGAAVIILSSQLPALLGFTKGWSGLADPSNINLYSLAFGLVSLAVLVLSKRLRPTFPTVLVVVLGAAALSWGLDLQAQGVAVVGALPQGLPVLVFSFHSPSLAPGHTPYVRSEADLDAFYDWWRGVFAYLQRRGVRPSSVSDLMQAVTLA